MNVFGTSNLIYMSSLLLFITASDSLNVELIPHRIVSLTPSSFTALGAPELSTACTEKCVLHESQSESLHTDHLLDFETTYSNGSRTLTTVTVRKQKNGERIAKKRAHLRTRRQVYGQDMRISIRNRHFLQDFPFAAAVRISTGCTGVLVTERHVLTAAHCIMMDRTMYKGQKDYVSASSSWSKAFPAMGACSKYTSAKSVDWGPLEVSMDYDYALLELRRPQAQPHMRLAASPPLHDLAGRRMHFSGFDSDRPGELVYRSCRVEQQTEHLLYQHCDARPGASGSGVYGRLWDKGRWERKVIGVFSGHQWVEVSGEPMDYNVAVRLTPLKYAQICYWIQGANFSCQNE